jgi:hypothetical protein
VCVCQVKAHLSTLRRVSAAASGSASSQAAQNQSGRRSKMEL